MHAELCGRYDLFVINDFTIKVEADDGTRMSPSFVHGILQALSFHLQQSCQNSLGPWWMDWKQVIAVFGACSVHNVTALQYRF